MNLVHLIAEHRSFQVAGEYSRFVALTPATEIYFQAA